MWNENVLPPFAYLLLRAFVGKKRVLKILNLANIILTKCLLLRTYKVVL